MSAPGPARSDDLDRTAVAAWARSGAMALTGRADGPALGPPAGLVPGLTAVAARLTRATGRLGRPLDLDVLALLGERAAVAGWTRHGDISCGGATRLLPARDGWLAVALARPDDLDLLPAWLGVDPGAAPPSDPPAPPAVWQAVAAAVAAGSAAEFEARAGLLGLPVAALPAGPVPAPQGSGPLAGLPLRAVALPGAAPARPSLVGLRVVDLSALWAGPLCASLLVEAGADVVKVESTSRPDGARRGPAGLFDLFNAGKRSVALDLGRDDGRRALRALLERAVVVIEASRPRALAQLGVEAEALVAGGGPQVWASITAHGRREPAGARPGFGDDAAVAGGLVSRDPDGPCFTADAVADPATGVVTATAVLDALAAGGRWLLDVSMAGVAAHLAGPTLAAAGAPAPLPPRARRPAGPGPRLGEHTGSVLGELAVS